MDSKIYIIEHIRSCCIDKTDLDIYCVVSFTSFHDNKIHFLITLFRMIICFFTQLGGMVIVLESELEEWEEYRFCEQGESKFEYAIMSFFFTIVVGIMGFEELLKLQNTGLYKTNCITLSNFPYETCNVFYCQFGRIINGIVILLVLYSSYILIYYTLNPLDLVLNSVAVFFILEIDQYFVTRRDYENILKYIENYENEIKEENYNLTFFNKSINAIIFYIISYLCILSSVMSFPLGFFFALCHWR